MFRKNYPLILTAIVSVAVIGIYLTATKQEKQEAPSAPLPVPVVTATESASVASSPTNPGASSSEQARASAETTETKIPRKGPLRIRKGDPIPEIFPNQAQRDEINRLATLPAEQALVPLAEYLKHTDPLVREEARAALIRLSSPAAVPYLREAASKAKSPEEAADLREAAEFLSAVASS